MVVSALKKAVGLTPGTSCISNIPQKMGNIRHCIGIKLHHISYISFVTLKFH